MSENDKNSHTDELLLQLIDEFKEFKESVEKKLNDTNKHLKNISYRISRVDSDIEILDSHITDILYKIHEIDDCIKGINEVQTSLIVDVYKLKAKNTPPK